MAAWARYRDGMDVGEQVLRVLAKYAPKGALDVFASDQHSSYLRLFNSFLEHVGEGRQATDEDVRDVCRRLARALDQAPSAALFNHLAYLSPDFRALLGPKTSRTLGAGWSGHSAGSRSTPLRRWPCSSLPW